MKFGSKIGNIVLIVLLIIIFLLLIVNLLVKLQRKKKESSFAKELQEDSQKQRVSKVEIQQAIAEISQRWSAAVAELKKAGMTLYSLPWYLLVGEPQSGKSTTLQHSEIEFPVGTEALSGTGGTRNCDWWFTNEAVILDTAGRFTFQEENAPDKDEWNGFLNLLKRHRANCPINGVIMVIPATSLLEDSMEEREAKAKNIRQKLFHIQEVMGIRFPVFLLITKADHILGFTEFFSKVTAAQQRQMLGWSNSAQIDKPYASESFSETFKNLCNEIHKWRLKFIGEEINQSLVDKLFIFPEELESLNEPLQEYLNIIFVTDKFHEPLFFRGFYFSSALQQGRPVARACRQLLGEEGIDANIIEELEQVFKKQRAFFIRDFYSKKVFQEQGLVVRLSKSQERDQIIRQLIWVGGGTIAMLSLFLLIWGVITFKRDIAPALDTVVEAKELLKKSTVPSIIESFKISSALSIQRKRIQGSHVSIMFFKGKENDVTRDIKLMHEHVFIKGCLHPLIQSVEERLVEIKWEESSDEHFNKFVSALKEYILWWSVSESPESATKKQLSQLSALSFVEFCQSTSGIAGSSYASERVDEWIGNKGFSRDKAEEEFKYLLQNEKTNPTGLLSKSTYERVIEPSLENFEKYWEIQRLEGVGWWFKLIDAVKKTDDIYQNILAPGYEDKETRETIQMFLERCKPFNAGIKDISQHLTDNVPIYQKNIDTAFRRICKNCVRLYDSLLPSGIANSRIEETINRQKERTIKQIQEEYTAFIEKGIYEYPHIVTVEGEGTDKATKTTKQKILSSSLSEEAKTIADILERVYVYADIYPSEEDENEFQKKLYEFKENVKDNPKGVNKYLQQWHEEQMKQRDEIIDIVNKLNDIEFHEKWHEKNLEEIMRRIASLALQERDSMAISAVYKEDASSGGGAKKGGGGKAKAETTYDFIALRKSLSEQNAMLAVFDSSNPKTYTQVLNKVLRELYQYLNHWLHVYQKFEPGNKLMTAKDWKSFYLLTSSVKKNLIDTECEPLKGFFRNMPYQEMKSLIAETPEAQNDPDIRSAFGKLEKITMAYQRGEIDSLSAACDEFTEYVLKLGHSPIDAWDKVCKKAEGLNAISRFKKTHKSIQNELIVGRLGEIEKRAFFLLRKGLKKDVTKDVGMLNEKDVSGIPVKFTLEFCKSTLPEMDRPSSVKYLQEYTNYWQNVYSNFIPGKTLINAANWNEFHHNISSMRTALIDSNDSLPALLLKNMNYKEMENIINSIPEAAADPKIKANLKKLEKVLIEYQLRDTLADMEKAGSQFTNCISSLDGLALMAWSQLTAGEVNINEMRAFTTIKRHHNGLEHELLMTRLEDIEEKAFQLLRNDVNAKFIPEWNNLMQEYKTKLEGKFPFKDFSKNDAETEKFKFQIPCVELSDLKEFLMDANGLEGLINKFNLSPILSNKVDQLDFPGDEKHKRFIVQCLRLKDFLYEQNEEKSHNVEISFSSKIRSPGTIPIGQRFTICRLTAPGGIRITFRESSQSKQQIWRLTKGGECLSIRGINEQTGQERVLEVYGGAMSFLSYITIMGKPLKESKRKQWVIPIKLPDTEVSGGSVYGKLEVKFSEPVPKMPVFE